MCQSEALHECENQAMWLRESAPAMPSQAGLGWWLEAMDMGQTKDNAEAGGRGVVGDSVTCHDTSDHTIPSPAPSGYPYFVLTLSCSGSKQIVSKTGPWSLKSLLSSPKGLKTGLGAAPCGTTGGILMWAVVWVQGEGA